MVASERWPVRAAGRSMRPALVFLGCVACAKIVGADFDHSAPRQVQTASAAERPALLARLTAPRREQTSAQFGYTCAIDAKGFVVTAPYQDVETEAGIVASGGAAYLFDLKNASAPPAPLVAPDVGALDGVLPGSVVAAGFVGLKDWGSLRVALSDDLVVVGVPAEDSATKDPADNSAPEAGAVYVYRRAAPGWPPQYIKAPAPQAGAVFGEWVSLSGSRLAVGAPSEDGAAADSGAVYVYEWRDGRFDDASPARITPEIAHEGDSFGMSVEIENDRMVVGASGEASKSTGLDGDPTDTSLKGNGAVYVYRLANGQWSLEQYVKPSVAKEMNFFGFSVSLSNGRFAVGTPGASKCPDDLSGPSHGAVYVVGPPGDAHPDAGDGATASGWAIEKCLSTGAVAEGLFGWSVGLLGDRLVVGAPWDPNGGNSDAGEGSRPYSGAAHLYGRTATGDWTERAYIKAPDVEANDVFGFSVAIAPGLVAVGAPFEAGGAHGPDPGHYSGAAYLFSTGDTVDGGAAATPE